jgi:DNA-binding LacI/PurR family transcriptional regulator
VINRSNSRGVNPGFGNILSDDTELGRVAALHLMATGRKVFLALGQEGAVFSRERLLGFTGGIEQAWEQLMQGEPPTLELTRPISFGGNLSTARFP